MAQVIEFIVVMIWLSVVAAFAINSYSRAAKRKNQYNIDEMISHIDYNEEKIIKHLDTIIDSAIDEYILLNIAPKQIYYINDKMQTEMCNYLIEQVPSRISKTLITQLGIIYDDSYIGKFIGNEIYMTVTSRVLDFNMDGTFQIPGNVTGNKKEH